MAVPLAHYAESGDADVGLNCRCGAFLKVPMAAAMRRVELAGEDPAEYPIICFALLVTDPCGRCGQWRWQSRPHFHPAPGMPGYDAYQRKKRPPAEAEGRPACRMLPPAGGEPSL